jgi:hypothetical protein
VNKHGDQQCSFKDASMMLVKVETPPPEGVACG